MSEVHAAKDGFPIRALYARLCQLEDDGARKLHHNLEVEHDDYKSMKGPPEARFYEWAHTRLFARTFISGITKGVFRTSDLVRLAEQCGVPLEEHAALRMDKILLARKAMESLGVREPEHPLEIQDGVRTVQRAVESLNAATSGESRKNAGNESLVRRGAERFLASLIIFLWDSGRQHNLRDVVREGRHGFQCRPAVAKSLEHGDKEFLEWLLEPGHGADLGALNHLLRCVGKELKKDPPAFLGPAMEVWHPDAFRAFDDLATSLLPIAHDRNRGAITPTDGEILCKIKDAASAVMEILLHRGITWRPTAVTFFRRIEDGHGVHYEGWDSTNTRRMFFECKENYRFHVPYVYVAATNPQAVDAQCVELRSIHSNPVALDDAE